MNAKVITSILAVTIPCIVAQIRAQTNVVLLSENFESGILDSRISIATAGTFNQYPGIIATRALGGAHAFGFGLSTCGANCWMSYVSYMTITFPGGASVDQLSFISTELFGSWGSQGYVFLDPAVLPSSTNEPNFITNGFAEFDQHENNAPATTNNVVIPINQWVTNIVLVVEDISDQSEIVLDDLLVTGNPTNAACAPTATATVQDGYVAGATITDSGCGLINTPLVLIQGGGGTGAGAVAIVSNGVLSDIIITNAGTGYTNAPNIWIGQSPSISTQPQSVTVNAFDAASFSVAAVGPPLPSYQWSFNGTNIAGATFNTLTISNVVQTNLGTYGVLVSNVFGSVNSFNAVLSMYPFIATPFGGLDTYWGYTNTLSVEAWGSGPLSFQWYQNGAALPGATNQDLTLTSIVATNAGLYSLVVTSALGSVTNTPEQVVVNPAGVFVALYPGVTITGVVGYNYIIQSTANLSDTNSWVTMTNLTLTQPIELWMDTNTDASLPGNSYRFYQVLPGQ
jgi:hypothetical protein